MITILSYRVSKNDSWSVDFRSNVDAPIGNYKAPCVGFKTIDKNGKEKWVVFEVLCKTTCIVDYVNNDVIYEYEAVFLGYRPDTSIKLEKEKFEWIMDKEVIEKAQKESCWT